jgi:nucleoside-diphosphate-sugar epimerase
VGLSRGPSREGIRSVPDYLDVGSLSAALAGCDVVVHLAARAHVLKEAVADPGRAFREANCDAAEAVARAAQAAGVRRMVLLSSIGIHGIKTSGHPFTESDPPAPVELYAKEKLRGEKAVAAALAGGPTDYVILRPPLVYAEDCPGNFRNLMRLVYRLPLVPLGGLRRPRTLIHVDHLCDAIVVAGTHPRCSRGTFIVSDREDLSVADIAGHLNRGFGRHPARVLAVPEVVLRGLAAVVGRSDTVDRLAGELRVDAGAFSRATGWQPHREASEAMAMTARRFAELVQG